MTVALSPLTGEQIAAYQTNGFLACPDVLSPNEVRGFRDALAQATSRPGTGYFFREGQQYTQHVNLWTTSDAVRPYVFNPKLAEMARQLSQSQRVRLWHDQEIIKMPGNRASSWHQDLTVWPMVEAGPLTCWIAMVDVTVQMGCMSFIPGSHRWGRLAVQSLPNDMLDSLEGVALLVPEDKRDLVKPTTIEVKAGSCTFHNALTLHYAAPNQTQQPREGFIINYVPDDITFNGKKHVTTDHLNLTPGQPIAGDLFPVLASIDPSEVVRA